MEGIDYRTDEGFSMGIRLLLRGQIRMVRRSLPDAMRAEAGDARYLRLVEAQHLRNTHTLASMLPEATK